MLFDDDDDDITRCCEGYVLLIRFDCSPHIYIAKIALNKHTLLNLLNFRPITINPPSYKIATTTNPLKHCRTERSGGRAGPFGAGPFGVSPVYWYLSWLWSFVAGPFGVSPVYWYLSWLWSFVAGPFGVSPAYWCVCGGGSVEYFYVHLNILRNCDKNI